MDPLRAHYEAASRPPVLLYDVVLEDTHDEVALLVSLAVRLLFALMVVALVWRRRVARLVNRLLH